MARLSPKTLAITAVVVLVVVLLFRGAGRWLIDAIGTMHGHGGGH
jgi:ABC-type antimicrobial peptide transport system permease subunit